MQYIALLGHLVRDSQGTRQHGKPAIFNLKVIASVLFVIISWINHRRPSLRLAIQQIHQMPIYGQKVFVIWHLYT